MSVFSFYATVNDNFHTGPFLLHWFNRLKGLAEATPPPQINKTKQPSKNTSRIKKKWRWFKAGMRGFLFYIKNFFKKKNVAFK